MMKKIISFGIVALLLISMAFAYGGSSGGVYYATTYKTTTDNFVIHNTFNNKALVSVQGNAGKSLIKSVDFMFNNQQSGSLDVYESTKYNNQTLGNLKVNKMILLDAPKFSSATLHITFKQGEVVRVVQRISTDGKNDVWMDLFPDSPCKVGTVISCDMTTRSNGIIAVLN